MIKQIQDGDDVVFKSNDRGYGSADVEVLRLSGTSAKTVAALAAVGALIGSSPVPKVAPSAATQLGTGPTATIVGTVLASEVTLTTGTTPAAAAAATPYIAFTLTVPAGVFATTPYCSTDTSNALASELEAGGITAATQAAVLYFDRAASTPTSLVFKIVSNGTPTLAASSAYKFQIVIAG